MSESFFLKQMDVRLSTFSAAFILLALFTTSGLASAETLRSQCVTEPGCQSEEQPLWEIGVAAFGVYGPDYPAADENSTNRLILPYLIYRGEIIRAGEDGFVKAHAFETERVELDLSLDGAFNADSDDNDAREGMDDLDYLFGIGPELKVHLYRDEAGQKELDLKFQLRAVFSTDLSNLNQRGYAFETQLRYEHEHLFHPDLKFVGSVGPIWATEKLMDYFYQVDSKDVLPQRQEFDASGGYLGTELNAGMVVTMLENRGRLFFGVRVGFHQEAENEDSPLFRDETTYAVGLGFAYQLFESEKKIIWR